MTADLAAVADLRHFVAPTAEPFPGFDPAGDAAALVLRGSVPEAGKPIPGHQILGSFRPGQRYVIRIPAAWNGKLAVCGTPATRSEHANGAIFGDYLLEHGYAYAASNKGIPFNARVDDAPSADPSAYNVPFALGAAPPDSASIRFGALEPERVPVRAWHDDYAALVVAAKEAAREVGGRTPSRTYALGLSIGGGQVRWLLERRPELVDGGVEWAAVYWNVEHAFIRYLPEFLRRMPAYVASGYRDRALHDEIVAAGFPPDRLQDGPLASLWNAHYAALPPFYADLTTFVFAGILDAGAPPPATLAARAAYVPTANAERSIGEIAHSGRIERPLIAVAGDADAFITPQHNFDPYLAAVAAAHRAGRYWQFEVPGGTHVDAFAAFGWNLRAQLPFARRAFELLVDLVEHGVAPAGAGTKRRVDAPDAM